MVVKPHNPISPLPDSGHSILWALARGDDGTSDEEYEDEEEEEEEEV